VTRAAVFTVALTLLSAALGACRAADRTDATPPGEHGALAPVAWLSGSWRGGDENGTWEEHWMSPEAGVMTGSFRMTRAGRALVHEIMLLEATPEGVMFRLVHVSPGGTVWEREREAPTTLELVHADGREIALRNTDPDSPHGPGWIVYTRDGATMDAWVGSARDRSGDGFTLTYRRR